jgi:hypothetical protein
VQAVDNLGPDDLDAEFFIWAMHRHIDPHRLPERQVLIRLDFRDLPKVRWQLILNPTGPEVCLKGPGFEVDLFWKVSKVTVLSIRQFHRRR